MKIKTQENINMFDKLGTDVQSFFNDLETNNIQLLTSKIEEIRNDIITLIKISLIKNLQKEENPRVISSDNKNIQIEINTQNDDILSVQNIEDIERRLVGQATNGKIETTMADLITILNQKIIEESCQSIQGGSKIKKPTPDNPESLKPTNILVIKENSPMMENFDIEKDIYNITNTQIEINRIQRLDDILRSEKNARPWQQETWINIKNMISKGINRGAIILPCSSGKTRIVAELLKMNNITKLYLLPKNVIGISVTEDLAKWGVPKGKIIDCTNGQEDVKLRTLDISSIQDHVIVANYRGLLNLRNNQKNIFDQLIAKVGMVLSDEAHRSLGTETRKTIDECMDFESLLNKSENKLHLLFTSTPKLLFKEIFNYYPYTIISKTMENVYIQAKNSDIESPLVLPKFRRMGPVYLTLNKNVNHSGGEITEEFFTKHANKIRVFVDRNGDPLEKKMFNEYIKLKKENGGYAPGLGVCNTISQAQRYASYFQKQGINARRCTGSNKEFPIDLDYSQLKDFMDRGGVVFTADAITEGINIPSLRVIMECAYTGSPARVVQSIGRITRAISDEELTHLKKINPKVDESNLKKTHSNTTCLGPSMRWADYEPIEKKQAGIRNNTGTSGNKRKKVQLKTFYDFILDGGEMGYETMIKEGDLFTGEGKLSLGDNMFSGKFKSPDLWDLVRNDIKKYSREPLDKEEEKIVIEKCKQGDENAKQKLISANVRFVLYKAKKRYYYYKKRYPQMQSTINDFVSAGFEGFMESIDKIDKFKTELDYSFITFAQAYIQNGFRDLFHKEENCLSKIPGIYIPRITIKKYFADAQEIEENNENIISAIENDLPNRNKILEEGFIDKISLRKKYSTKKTAGGKTSLYDLMNTNIVDDLDSEISKDKADEEMTKESLRKEIGRILYTITDREADIIRGFFGIGEEEKNLEELCETYGLTSERVRQIKEKAIKRCRHTSRSKILRGYLGDPEYVPNLSSSIGALQSMGIGDIYHTRMMKCYDNAGMMSSKKIEILFVTGSGVLATNILTFMNLHEISGNDKVEILNLNITRVAQLRTVNLNQLSVIAFENISKALLDHKLDIFDEELKRKIQSIRFNLVD